ncbi:hypothetical protein HBI80_081900 [Parastagonospora nodorum]|nr:hypothetical protein HBI03_104660 [Parastagonospora nodorum]KAH4275179.1 hypothetical protein HBI04_130470 [Parastagonospora nodorum]KAH4906274.1 hypothetical protein HBI80_081900 [Parastagonospora nodorum]KAH4936037.1 hypothetical protein HBI79_075880 [Parastagonospora nodorum]KAH5308415.1 hypothetical protein HBI12_159260 [Parastagonospora nodorum]
MATLHLNHELLLDHLYQPNLLLKHLLAMSTAVPRARPLPAQSTRRKHTPSQLAPIRPTAIRPTAPNHTCAQQVQARSPQARKSSSGPVTATATRTAGQNSSFTSVQPVRVTTTRTGGLNPTVRHELSATTFTIAASAERGSG